MDKDETSSDFEYHESEAQDFGQSHGTQHTHAILAVAAGIKELVELLRPLVERQHVDGRTVICPEVLPMEGGIRCRCERPIGHDGPHKDGTALYGGGVGSTWTTAARDAAPAYQTVDEKRCTALSTLVESQPPMRCIRLFGHNGECRFEGLWEE